jgi:hypothetical protein
LVKEHHGEEKISDHRKNHTKMIVTCGCQKLRIMSFWQPKYVAITQFLAVILLAINAIVDTSRAPGAAAVEYLIALAALLGSISALAGLPLNHVQSADVAPEG